MGLNEAPQTSHHRPARGVTLFKSVYETHKNDDTASIAVGFADLPSFGNEVAHESRNVGINFKGKPGDPEFIQSVESQLTHPARLHRQNVDAHLAFLKSYFNNADRTQSRQTLIQEMSCLHNQGQKSETLNTRINTIRKELSTMSGPSYFPLNDNPFVHHAMQFLWDPDFVIFLRDAVAIQQRRTTKSIDRDKSNKQMGQLISKIYPKLESYINYLYGRISYPEKIRNTMIMND